MNHKEEAVKRVEEFYNKIPLDDFKGKYSIFMSHAKQCALLAIEREYNSLREQLFNLRSCGVIESEKTYLFRIQELIDEEKQIKQEIEKL